MGKTLAEIRAEFRASFPDSKLSVALPGQKIPIPQHLRKPGLDEAEAVFTVKGCESLPGSQVSLDEFLSQFTLPAEFNLRQAKEFLKSDNIPGSVYSLKLWGVGEAGVVVRGGTNSKPAVRLSSLGSTAIKEKRPLNDQEAALYQNEFYALAAAIFGLGNDEVGQELGITPRDSMVRIFDDCFASLVDVLALDGLILELSKQQGVKPPTAMIIQGDAASMQALSLFDEYAAMHPDRLFWADVARVVASLSNPDPQGHHANYLMTAAEIDQDAKARSFAAGDYGENGLERDWSRIRASTAPTISRFRMEDPRGGLNLGETLVLTTDDTNSLSIALKNGGFMVEATRRAARAARNSPLEDTGTRVIGDGKRLDGINPQTGQLETGAALSGLTEAISQFLLQTAPK